MARRGKRSAAPHLHAIEPAHLFFFCVTLMILLSSAWSSEGADLLFPEEKVSDLALIMTDPDGASFFLRSGSGEEVDGYLGDLVGAEQAEVVEITERAVILETAISTYTDEESVVEECFYSKLPLVFTGESPSGGGKGVR